MGLWIRRSAAFIGLSLGAANSLAAQIDVDGGTQSIVWPSNCATTVLFKNDTRLPLAGLWIGINLDSTTNPPEIREISVHDQFAGRTWDVDDNENFNNDNLGEGNEIDSTPLGNAAGWHRVQARSNADVINVNENFTIRLCDSGSGSLAGRTIFFVPMAPRPGEIGGDNSARTEPPLGYTEAFPFNSLTLDGAGAPPGSTSFSVAVVNNDPTKRLKKLQITPPPGIVIIAATADGGIYNEATRTIIWPSPIIPNGVVQVNVTVNALSRALSITIAFDVTKYVDPPPGGGLGGFPTLPAWGPPLLIGAFALAWYARRRRQRAPA